MKNYSIWIIPPEPLYAQLKQIIADLSKKYSSPDFTPHMTLLGEISSEEDRLLDRANNLASSIRPFPLNLSVVSFSTTYFQSVFVRIQSTALLMDSNLKGKEIFNQENSVFMPHISLIYGNHDMNIREKIAQTIRLPKSSSFMAEKLVIIPSTPDPAGWRHLAEIPFKK